MPTLPARQGLCALLVLTVCPPLIAHEDDPKVRDRQAPVTASPYFASAWSTGSGFQEAVAFEAQGVTLLSWMPLSEFGLPASGSDCWGYTSPSGREYALFTHYDGMHVVEVTDADDPQIIAFVNGPDSMWRDVKVYQSYAYVVSEGGDGIQVVNLTNVDAGVVTTNGTVTSGGDQASHNVAIDEASGFLYRCGGGENGLRFYSLSNPASPSYVGSWNDRYVHDAQVHTYTSGPYSGKQIAFACGGFNGGWTDSGLSIVDVTNKNNPIHRGQVTWPGAEYSHQAWLSEDGLTLFVNDELDEGGSTQTTTYIIDVSNIDNPIYKGSFTNGNDAVGHNLYVKGDLIYEANYTSGLRVFDASNPLAPVETMYFDTVPSEDKTSFNGLWNVYPFFDSGTVIGSDLERGLFIWWVGDPAVELDVVGGAPTMLDPGGVTLTVDMTEANPGNYVPGSAQLFYDAGAGAVGANMVDLGGGSFSAQLPSLPCGTVVRYYMTAESTNGLTWVSPPNGALHEAVVSLESTVVVSENFQTNGGWSSGAAGDDASTGQWTRQNPIGTAAQPEFDHSSSGTQCWFTGQGSSGGDLGENDVDGGKTTLLSATYNLLGHDEPVISYWRWYSNATGSVVDDTFVIDISNNGGGSWTNVESIGPVDVEALGGWVYHEFKVSDYVTPSASVRMRFIASDEGSGSIVEAAIDDFTITANDCPLSADKATLPAIAGGTVSFDLNGGSLLANKTYFLLGSLSGTTPGFSVGAVHVPLQQDVYFTYSLAHANSLPLLNTFGTLDGSGRATAQFALTPGLASLLGLTAHHAWLGLNPATLEVEYASNALPIEFE